MANVKSFNILGDKEERLEKLIITTSPQVLTNNDGTGNIIIYVHSDDDPYCEEENSGNEYRDLYIGDEHIAGGFGFKNIETRNYIQTKVQQLLTTLNDVQSRLDFLEQPGNNSGSENTTNATITIPPKYSHIETEYGIYTLSYDKDTGELKVTNEYRPQIFDVKFEARRITTKGEEINGEIEFDKFYSVIDAFLLTKISLIIEGDVDNQVEGFSIYYILNNDTNKQNYIAGSLDSFIYLSRAVPSNPIVSVKTKYTIEDPNITPYTAQQLIEIELNGLKANGNGLFTNNNNEQVEGTYDFRIVLYTKNNTKIVKQLGKFHLIPPVYYGVCELQPYMDKLGVFNTVVTGEPNKRYDISFYHEQTPIKGWIMIPQSILGRMTDDPVMYFNTDIFVKTEWIRFPFGNPGGDDTYGITYKKYHTPNDYTGDLNWQIQLNY